MRAKPAACVLLHARWRARAPGTHRHVQPERRRCAFNMAHGNIQFCVVWPGGRAGANKSPHITKSLDEHAPPQTRPTPRSRAAFSQTHVPECTRNSPRVSSSRPTHSPRFIKRVPHHHRAAPLLVACSAAAARQARLLRWRDPTLPAAGSSGRRLGVEREGLSSRRCDCTQASLGAAALSLPP